MTGNLTPGIKATLLIALATREAELESNLRTVPHAHPDRVTYWEREIEAVRVALAEILKLLVRRPYGTDITVYPGIQKERGMITMVTLEVHESLGKVYVIEHDSVLEEAFGSGESRHGPFTNNTEARIWLESQTRHTAAVEVVDGHHETVWI